MLYGANQPGKGDKNDVYFQVKKQATKHSDRFKKDGSKISWLSIKLPDETLLTSKKKVDDKVIGLSSGILKIAVLDLVVKKFMLENLILFCTSSMEIRQDYLNRVSDVSCLLFGFIHNFNHLSANISVNIFLSSFRYFRSV